MRRSWARRSAKVAKLGAKVGAAHASTAARKVFASAERRVELDEAPPTEITGRIRETPGH